MIPVGIKKNKNAGLWRADGGRLMVGDSWIAGLIQEIEKNIIDYAIEDCGGLR